jgi:hypothetical protein
VGFKDLLGKDQRSRLFGSKLITAVDLYFDITYWGKEECYTKRSFR